MLSSQAKLDRYVAPTSFGVDIFTTLIVVDDNQGVVALPLEIDSDQYVRL